VTDETQRKARRHAGIEVTPALKPWAKPVILADEPTLEEAR
jgi:hypothetical protein